jgi:hypothetical protein
MSTAIRLYDQSGTEQQVHPDDVKKALQQGWKQPVMMSSPDGQAYEVHPADAAKAIQKGWSVGQPTPKFNNEVGVPNPKPVPSLRLRRQWRCGSWRSRASIM